MEIRELQKAIKLKTNEGAIVDPLEAKIIEVARRVPENKPFAAVCHVVTEIFSGEEILTHSVSGKHSSSTKAAKLICDQQRHGLTAKLLAESFADLKDRMVFSNKAARKSKKFSGIMPKSNEGLTYSIILKQ